MSPTDLLGAVADEEAGRARGLHPSNLASALDPVPVTEAGQIEQVDGAVAERAHEDCPTVAVGGAVEEEDALALAVGIDLFQSEAPILLVGRRPETLTVPSSDTEKR